MFEHGVDILCTEETPLGTEFCGLQVKSVPISGSKTKKKGNVTELINQATSALRHCFTDERDNTEKRLDKYFIITSCGISDASSAEIRDAVRDFGRTLRFVDGQALAHYVQEYLHPYVTDYFARRNMVAEFGHILRTPLQGITSDLSWLRSILSNMDVNEKALLACDRAEEHIQVISHKIRTYIRAIAPPKTLGMTFRSVDIESIASSVLHGFSARAGMKGIQLKMESERLSHIETDPDALDLILTNLIDNAVKYSFDNKYVLVHLRQLEDYVQIEVENFGILITESQLHHLWDRSYRGDPNAKDIHGMGYGLAVVKDLIEELRGKIEVTCLATNEAHKPKIGLVRFTVLLPLHIKKKKQ